MIILIFTIFIGKQNIIFIFTISVVRLRFHTQIILLSKDKKEHHYSILKEVLEEAIFY